MTKEKRADLRPYDDLVKVRLDLAETMRLVEIEHKLGYADWLQFIPFIPFPPEWEIQVIPPFGQALCRFRVQLRDDHDCYVSVYLDAHNNLGAISWGKHLPYWEVYPSKVGEPDRCEMNDTAELLTIIGESLDAQGTKGSGGL